jgi:hypothetical protein
MLLDSNTYSQQTNYEGASDSHRIQPPNKYLNLKILRTCNFGGMVNSTLNFGGSIQRYM